jgi:integrase/recombinase XerD
MLEEIDDFLRYCSVERRLAPLTCSAYERDVRACHAFLCGAGLDSWAQARPHLRRFLATEATYRPAPSSQARTVAALKGFFRFLVENEAIERDPALVIRTPKKREALPDVLDQRELGRLLGAVEREDVWKRHFSGRRERDRLLLALFAYAGLRRSELLGLNWDDVDLERRLLRVHRAKGGRCASGPPPPRPPAADRELPHRAWAERQRPAVRRRPGTATNADDSDADVPAIRAGRGSQRPQAGDAPHAPARVCLRAVEGWREPTSDPGTPRPQASRLNAALYAGDRARVAWRRQATTVRRRLG